MGSCPKQCRNDITTQSLEFMNIKLLRKLDVYTAGQRSPQG